MKQVYLLLLALTLGCTACQKETQGTTQDRLMGFWEREANGQSGPNRIINQYLFNTDGTYEENTIVVTANTYRVLGYTKRFTGQYTIMGNGQMLFSSQVLYTATGAPDNYVDKDKLVRYSDYIPDVTGKFNVDAGGMAFTLELPCYFFSGTCDGVVNYSRYVNTKKLSAL